MDRSWTSLVTCPPVAPWTGSTILGNNLLITSRKSPLAALAPNGLRASAKPMRLIVRITILPIINQAYPIYYALVLMGVQASLDVTKRKKDGTFKDEIWPSTRTVLIRADEGIGSQPHAEGASRLFDLENWMSNVEMHELRGSHFGMLNPNSGLADVMNKVIEQGDVGHKANVVLKPSGP